MRTRPALVLAVGSALVLIALAARGTSPVPYQDRGRTGSDAPAPTQSPARLPEDTEAGGSTAGASLIALVVFVLVLLAIGLLWLLIAYLRGASGRRRRRGSGVAAVEDQPLDAPAPPEVLVRGARRALRDLRAAADSGPPGDAVVAAWLALERAAAESGTPREAHQTPTEFTGGLLTRHRVDPDATTALRRVYQRARFGSAEVTDDDARTAVDALEHIVRDLG